MVILEGNTIKIGAYKISLGELCDVFTMVEPRAYSKAIHNIVYGNAQLISEGINSGVNVEDHLPNKADYYYAKLLADAFANMEVKKIQFCIEFKPPSGGFFMSYTDLPTKIIKSAIHPVITKNLATSLQLIS